MTPKELRHILIDLGITQTALARFFDLNERTVQHWTAGRSKIPGPAIMMLRYMLATNTTPAQVARILKLPPPHLPPKDRTRRP